MITFKTGLSKKEQTHIRFLLEEISDIYGDFYLTKNNLRLYIKENQNILFDCLKKGDKIAYDDNGMAIITGFSDKMPRKYIKILAEDNNQAEKLIKVINWNLKCDLFVKIKKNNPLKEVFQANGFRFMGGRGKEMLLVRKAKGEYNVNRDKR